MKVKRLRVLLALLVAVLAGYMIMVTVAEMPPYGMPNNPSRNEVTERYIDDSLEETGVLNMITAIILDYRAYDTMFETIVLFTAVVAVLITLKTDLGRSGKR